MIFLYDSNDLLLDQLMYPDEMAAGGLENGQSLGRTPDGAGTTGPIVVSPGAPNVAVP